MNLPYILPDSTEPATVGELVRQDSVRALHKMLVLLCAAPLLLVSSGCMTGSVIHDAKYPKETDAAPWANYLLLPITVPADIATSPIQIPAYVSYMRGHRPVVPTQPVIQD